MLGDGEAMIVRDGKAMIVRGGKEMRVRDGMAKRRAVTVRQSDLTFSASVVT